MSGHHVLVVDDERDFAALIAETVRSAGFRVSVAWDRDGALRILEAEDVDLVVTDVMMEHLSAGFDLAHAVKARRSTSRLPVVIVSGVHEVFDVTSQIGEGWIEADAFLDKPVDPDVLLATVTGLLGPSTEPAKRTMSGEETAMSDRKLRVLVVEDEPDYAELLAGILGDAGYRVVLAADGEDAIEKVRRDPPDLISLDLQMPRRSGIEVFRRLKAEPPWREIPVVVVTGLTSNHPDLKSFVRTFLEREHLPLPDAYVEKPIDADDFLRVVADALRHPTAEGRRVGRVRGAAE